MLINRLDGGIINIIYLLEQFFGLLFKYYLTNKITKAHSKTKHSPPPNLPKGEGREWKNERIKKLKAPSQPPPREAK